MGKKDKKYESGKRTDYGPGRPDQVWPTETQFLEIDNYHLLTWGPDPDPEKVKPTQVHMTWEIRGLLDVQFLTRFKSPVGLDQFIDLLIEYREAVWGKRPQKGNHEPD